MLTSDILEMDSLSQTKVRKRSLYFIIIVIIIISYDSAIVKRVRRRDSGLQRVIHKYRVIAIWQEGHGFYELHSNNHCFSFERSWARRLGTTMFFCFAVDTKTPRTTSREPHANSNANKHQQPSSVNTRTYSLIFGRKTRQVGLLRASKIQILLALTSLTFISCAVFCYSSDVYGDPQN